jgi:hypothetical protein
VCEKKIGEGGKIFQPGNRNRGRRLTLMTFLETTEDSMKTSHGIAPQARKRRY